MVTLPTRSGGGSPRRGLGMRLPDVRQVGQVSPAASRDPGLSISPAAFGAVRDPGAVGREIAQGAEAVGQASASLREAEERVANNDARLWQLKTLAMDGDKWTTRLRELSGTAEEGAPGFEDKVKGEFEKYHKEAIANAPERIRAEYDARLTAIGSDIGSKAREFELGARIKKRVRDYERGIDANTNMVFNDPSQFDTVLSMHTDLLDVLEIPGDQKQALKRSAEKTLANAAVTGRIISHKDPKNALASLLAGDWDAYLDPDHKMSLVRSAQTASAVGKAEAGAVLRDHIASIRATGVGVPGAVDKITAAYDGDDLNRVMADVSLAQRFYGANQQILHAPPEAIRASLESFKPKPGQANFADHQQTYAELVNSAETIMRRRADDPAGFAASMPSVQQRASAATGPGATRETVQAIQAGQDALGIPKPQQRVLSKAQAQTTISNLISKPMAERGGILMQLQETYGDQFPSVMRDLSDKGFNGIGLDPRTMVLASIAGNPALSQQMATVLDTGSKELRDGLDRTAVSDAEKNVRTALSPWMQTVRAGAFGMEREPMLNGIASAVEDLAVSYVRNGEDAATAATRAADQVINDRFTVQDTYYIPKDAPEGVPYSPSRIGAYLDTQKTREAIEAAGVASFGAGLSFKPVPDSFTPQEQALIQYHRDNLSRGAELKDEQGTTTVLITGMQGPDGREYLVPGFFDGKRQGPDAIAARVGKIGWDRFPSYATLGDAEQATKRLHDLIEEDTRVGPNAALDRERTIATAVNSGFWATNANGTGVYLMVPFQGGGALPLLKPDGSRYEFSFRAASDKGFQPASHNPAFGFEAQP